MPKVKGLWQQISNEDVLPITKALEAAHADFVAGYNRMSAMHKLDKSEWILNNKTYFANCISAVKYINQIKDNKTSINELNLTLLTKSMNEFVFDVLGLKNKNSNDQNHENL